MSEITSFTPPEEAPKEKIWDKLKHFRQSFSSKSYSTKVSLVVMVVILLVTPVIVGSKTGFFAHAGTSLFNNCTPIPTGITQSQIQQLSQSGQVVWCNTQGVENVGGVSSFSFVHSFGGFSIDTPTKATQAAGLGIHVGFLYGHPTILGSALEGAYAKNNISEVDAYISSHIYYYECHKALTVANHPEFCAKDNYPDMTEDNLLNKYIIPHLQDVEAHYPLVKGFWVLDDQPAWDRDTVKLLIQKIHPLIQQYAPGHPAICGFGSAILPNNTYSFTPAVFQTFSPQACDVVGLYIYSSSLPVTTPDLTTSTMDWVMAGLLPQEFSVLKQQGWDIQKEPLIGITQAWGGYRTDLKNTQYEMIPSADNIKTQAEGFCKAGAIGIVFYSWNDSTVQRFPWNTNQMAYGIGKAVSACKNVWAGVTPTPTPKSIPPAPISVRTGCLGKTSYVTFSWTGTTGAKTYVVDWWGTINGVYNEYQINGIKETSIRIPSTIYTSTRQLRGSPTTLPTFAVHGFVQDIHMGVAVKVSTPVTGAYSKVTDFWTSVCPS